MSDLSASSSVSAAAAAAKRKRIGSAATITLAMQQMSKPSQSSPMLITSSSPTRSVTQVTTMDPHNQSPYARYTPQEYIDQSRLEMLVKSAMNLILLYRPPEPLKFLANHFQLVTLPDRLLYCLQWTHCARGVLRHWHSGVMTTLDECCMRAYEALSSNETPTFGCKFVFYMALIDALLLPIPELYRPQLEIVQLANEDIVTFDLFHRNVIRLIVCRETGESLMRLRSQHMTRTMTCEMPNPRLPKEFTNTAEEFIMLLSLPLSSSNADDIIRRHFEVLDRLERMPLQASPENEIEK